MLKQRVLTAIVLLLGFLAALFLLPPSGWALLMALVCGLGGWEWARMLRLSSPVCVTYGGVVGALTVAGAWSTGLAQGVVGSWNGLVWICALSAVFWVGAAPLWLKFKWQPSQRWLMLGLGAVLLVPTALALCYLRLQGVATLLFFMALIWLADIGAYFSGRAFGRHKLAPTISPGKTWEGAAGGALAVLVVGLLGLCARELINGGGQFVFALVALLVLAALSVVGDLFESLIKRQSGFKDSSQLLPGHGGILDRIDSLTSTMPLITLLLLASH